MDNDKWFSFSKKNESLITIDEVKFIFSQAEAQLKESIISGGDALTRSTILLSILIGLLTSLVGYFINQLNTNPVLNKLDGTLITTIIFTGYVTYKLVYNLFGKTYWTTGSQPKDLLHDWYFDTYKVTSDREKSFIINEIKAYQQRIENNNSTNKTKWDCFNTSLVFAAFIPVQFLLCYIIFLLF